MVLSGSCNWASCRACGVGKAGSRSVEVGDLASAHLLSLLRCSLLRLVGLAAATPAKEACAALLRSRLLQRLQETGAFSEMMVQ